MQLAAAARALMRAPLPALDGFSVGRAGQSGQFLVAILVLTAFEAPAVHLILHSHVSWPAQLVVAVLHVYGIAWLVGDLRLIRESGHRLTREGLELRLGARWRACVPYARIAKVVRISPPRRPEILRITPLDTPNVYLGLHDPVEVSGPYGIKRKAAKIALYVDDPAAFVAALGAELAR